MWIVGLHLFTLSGCCIAQPLYDVMGRSANFLIAHDAKAWDILALVLVLSVFPPMMLLGVEVLTARTARRASVWLHRGLIALFLGVLALLAVRQAPLPGWLLVALSVVFGCSGAATYARRSWLRDFLTVLSPATLVFPLYFLFATPVSSLLVDSSAPLRNDLGSDPSTPVVVLILDEFSVVSIMDESERVDSRRYPHLSALAADAYWFRNATTVSTDTTYAVPAMLSGRYPQRRRLATAADYPQTLLTLLGTSYDLRIFECVTRLCPDELCGRRPRRRFAERVGALLSDLVYVYLHLLLPAELADGLPSVSATWGDFGGRRRPDAEGGAVTASRRTGGPEHFARFLEALRSGRDSTLYLAHLLLPHWPWEFSPSGKEYGPLAMQVSGWTHPTPPDPSRGRGYYWGDDEWSLVQAFQRYLLQVGYVDRLIGELVGTLEETGLYESCLLIVVADHGVSFLPDSSRKQLTEGNPAHFAEVVNVPLFIKLPDQRQGAIIDRNVQTIDILPTIADVLDVAIPWEVDGRSAIDFGSVDEPEKRAFNTLDKPPVEGAFVYDTERLRARREPLARMLALFGSGDDPGALFRIGPRTELLGRAAGSRTVAAGSSTFVELDGPSELVERYDPESTFAPTHVSGRLFGSGSDGTATELAIAVNGLVRAVTWTFEKEERGGYFTAMLPEAALVPGTNQIEVFLISDAAGQDQLQRVPRRSEQIFSLGRSADGREELSRDGQAIPIAAGAVRGSVEAIVRQPDRGAATLTGWAADVAEGSPAERVLVFAEGRSVGSVEPEGVRPDLVRLSSRSGILRSGFRIAVPLSVFPDLSPAPEVRVFAVSARGVASELRLPAPATALRD